MTRTGKIDALFMVPPFVGRWPSFSASHVGRHD